MEKLYFIAVVPPADIREEITMIKEEIKEQYGSGHALRSPPHITLHMPFKWKDKKRLVLEKALGVAASQQDAFELELKNFDCFKPRVIFIDVVKSQTLEELQRSVNRSMKTLNVLNADFKNKPFHPHVTVAFRDLRKSKFLEAWDVFKKRTIQFQFKVESLVLLQHDGKKWQMEKDFPLNPISPQH